jgi:hypothetical protein
VVDEPSSTAAPVVRDAVGAVVVVVLAAGTAFTGAESSSKR